MEKQQRPGGDGIEVVLLGGGAVTLATGFAVWLGARLAVLVAGGSIRGGVGDWPLVAGRLLTGSGPSKAWGDLATDLPSSAVYWPATVLSIAVVVAALVALWWGYRRLTASEERTRFGQSVNAREASVQDVAPLVIDSVVPPVGRMLLGRLRGDGPLLATEDRVRHPQVGRAAVRQGNRGSVALIGPTGSGKTALATAAIATWKGPVVAVSVKRDLYDATSRARAKEGSVAVFDPSGATGLPTARWSPLQATITSSGALRTGRALAQAIPKGGVTNADYWAEHGEGLIGAFMCVAGLSRLLPCDDDGPPRPIGMEQLAAWVRTLATATDPTIHDLISRALDDRDNVEIQLLGRHAATTFTGVAREDEKVRSSVYSTAVLALKPWLEPAVAHSASASPLHFYSGGGQFSEVPKYVDLDWLMAHGTDRNNTLYLSAPSTEFERLSPVLGGVLADLKDTIHAWDIADRPLEKPLLIVVDEAAHLQLGWLPTEVSTIAALGAFFVTCWQNLAQIDHRYDRLADAVLSGHRTKCFFAGIDDLATARYLTTLLGHEETTRYSTSREVPSVLSGASTGRRSVSESTQRIDFAPAHTVREMLPGEAVVLHGTLPPIHLTALRHWDEPELRAILEPADPPTSSTTCPLTASPVDGTEHHAVDIATLQAAKAQLPAVRPAEASSARGSAKSRKQTDTQMELFGSEQGSVICELCKRELLEGEHKGRMVDGRFQRCCAPSCEDRRRAQEVEAALPGDHPRGLPDLVDQDRDPIFDTETEGGE